MKNISLLVLLGGFMAAQLRADDIYVVNIATKSVEKFAADGTPSRFANLDTSTFPAGIAADAAGNIYVYNPSFGANFITKIPPMGGSGTIFATIPNPVSGGGLAFDHAGNLFAPNYGNNTIYKINPSGVASVFVADPGDNSILDRPQAVAFDAAGNLYVSNDGVDRDNNEVNDFIEKFTPAGVASRFATATNPADDDQPILWAPQGMVFDSAGNLFVANVNGGFIEKFSPTGVASFFFDGATDPGLAIDSAGNLYSLTSLNGLGNIFKYVGTNQPVVFASDPGNGTVMYSPQYMIAVPNNSVARPKLSIIRSGSNAVLSWPVSASDFLLQSTTNLVTPSWMVVATVPATNNGSLFVTNAFGAGVKFFRLLKN